jgi:hypothetical protein
MKPLLLFPAIFLLSASARSQGGVEGYPFGIPADPRSVAMGESFVALPSNPAALLYNPAGLAGLNGVYLSYSRRALNVVPLIDEYMLHSVNGTLAVPFGVFAVQYNEKFLGTFLVATAANPDGIGTEETFYSYNVAVGFGTTLSERLDIGVAAKYYHFAGSSSAADYLFDAGLIYTLPPFHKQSAVHDSLCIGLSVQNIHVQGETSIITPRGTYPVQENRPEYFRAGISFALRTVPREESDLTTVAVAVTGEYRNLLNQPSTAYEGRSYWGIGVEAGLFEILTLRAGVYTQPFTGFDGERDRPAYRYGAGLNLPLRKLGAGIPLLVSINYAVQPLNQIVNSALAGFTEKSSLPAFSLDLHYAANLW